MKILEVRDGFIKFEADKNICLSSFVQVDGIDKSYVAQVLQLKRAGENSIAYAKILFLYDGELVAYDKTLPSKDAQVKPFTFDILSNSIIADSPIIAGKTTGEDICIKIDVSAFDKKMLVSVDDKDSNNLIIRNLVKQFNNLNRKVVIIDTLGIIEAKKYTAGVDFKLPLNKDSLAFMYRDCLNDATEESKSLIMEIFKDLAEYSETVPFVPFETLKSIVDDMVDNSHVFKLLVLKNKLAKFHRLGYFASSKRDMERLGDILDAGCCILDLSKLDAVFQNKYLEFIYESLKAHSQIQVFLELSNTVSKKSIKDVLSDVTPTAVVTHSKFKYLNDIKNVFDNFIIVPSFANNSIFNIYSTFLSAMPKDTYLISGEATNYIPLVSSLAKIDDIALIQPEPDVNPPEETEENTSDSNDDELEAVLAAEEEQDNIEEELLTSDEISAGIEEKSDDIIAKAAEETESVLPDADMFGGAEDVEEFEYAEETAEEIPPVSEEPELTAEDLDAAEISEYEEVPVTESFETEVHPAEVIEDYSPGEEVYEEISLAEETEPEEMLTEEIPESELLEEDTLEEIEVPADIDLDDSEIPVMEEPAEELASVPEQPEIEILPISSDDELDSIVELDPDEADENDIVIDMEEEEEPLSLDEQIVKDVDKVFTSRKEDEISDSDLDFIDELNTGELLEEVSDSDNTLEEIAEPDDEGILEPAEDNIQLEEVKDSAEILETRSSTTPIVPVYNADIPQEDMVMSDDIQQGDLVTHAKYGSGVVEKMIKYGNKTLFSINFDNIGRRLLDPALTEIKKA